MMALESQRRSFQTGVKGPPKGQKPLKKNLEEKTF